MRRRIITSRPVVNTLNTRNIEWDQINYCIHDVYVNSISKYNDLQEITYPVNGNGSNFSIEFTLYLLELKRNISQESHKILKFNVSKKDGEIFGISLILDKEIDSEYINVKMQFSSKFDSNDELNDFIVNIGTFDIISYNNQENVIIGEQLFDNKNPNLLKPWITIDFKYTVKIILNNMPINIRNFFDMNQNEFIVKDYSLN